MDSYFNSPVPHLLQNQPQLIEFLKTLTTKSTQDNFRSTVPVETLQKLNQLLQFTISISNEESDYTQTIIWLLRLFRNLCVNCHRNQQFLYDEQKFGTIKYLIGFLRSQTNSWSLSPTVKQLCLQLIGNSMVQNQNACKMALENFDIMDLVVQLLSTQVDVQVLNYAGMVGLTITQQMNSNSNDQQQLLTQIDARLIKLILNHLELEFIVLWFEALCTFDQFLNKIYTELQDSRLQFLHAIIGHKPCIENLNATSIKVLATNFKSLADTILVTKASLVPDDLNPLEVTLSVEFFCKLIEFKIIFEVLKNDGSFVTTVIYLLRTIHNLGTKSSESEGSNCFTPIETLGQPTGEATSEPWFLFKANLIRLIGGLVENHFENQNRVRELDCISVILNCTKIDSRNPFIPQCSIMTLKFLLENNSENQEYVKGLEKVGDAKLML